MLRVIKMYRKNFLIYFFLLLINFNNTYADIIREFKISGNDRVVEDEGGRIKSFRESRTKSSNL